MISVQHHLAVRLLDLNFVVQLDDSYY